MTLWVLLESRHFGNQRRSVLKDMLMCYCLAVEYLQCCLCITSWSLRLALTFSPCGFLLSSVLLIHTIMIHTAAPFWDWCVTHIPHDVACVTCCLTSSPSGHLCVCVCGQNLNRLLIVGCQSVTGVFSGISVYTHTQLRALAVTNWRWYLLCHHGSGIGKQMKANTGLFISMEKTTIVLMKHTRCSVMGA